VYLSKEALEEHPHETKFFPAKSMVLPVTDIILTSEQGPEAKEDSGVAVAIQKTQMEKEAKLTLCREAVARCSHWR